jgi:hypothetical protein
VKLGFLHWMIAIVLLANIAFFFWPKPPEPVQAPTALPAVKRLQLVPAEAVEEPPQEPYREPEPASQPLLEPAPEPLSEYAPEPALQLVQSCWHLGPLAEEAYSEVRVLLSDNDIVGQVTIELAARQPNYRVYLPTSGEEAEILRLSRELKSQGIDNFQIKEGKLADSLSLGLFNSEEHAQAVESQVEAAGHKARILRIEQGEVQYWVELTDTDLTRLGWVARDGEVEGYTGLDMRQQECP